MNKYPYIIPTLPSNLMEVFEAPSLSDIIDNMNDLGSYVHQNTNLIYDDPKSDEVNLVNDITTDRFSVLEDAYNVSLYEKEQQRLKKLDAEFATSNQQKTSISSSDQTQKPDVK